MYCIITYLKVRINFGAMHCQSNRYLHFVNIMFPKPCAPWSSAYASSAINSHIPVVNNKGSREYLRNTGGYLSISLGTSENSSSSCPAADHRGWLLKSATDMIAACVIHSYITAFGHAEVHCVMELRKRMNRCLYSSGLSVLSSGGSSASPPAMYFLYTMMT